MHWILILLVAQQSSVVPAWDTAKLFSELKDQTSRLDPILKQIKSTPAIAELLRSTITRNQETIAQSQLLARNPDRLADSLKLLEQIHDVQESLFELLDYVRRDQNPALAELIAGIEREGKPARDAFAQRVLDLTAEREQQFTVADHEAQRCRETLSKSPATRRTVKSK